jgi:prevent-host-death family protein
MTDVTTESVQAGDFKARCLALLDEVARNRTEIIVTKHGRPVARVVPVDVAPPTAGSVTLLAVDEEAYFSTGERWDADG